MDDDYWAEKNLTVQELLMRVQRGQTRYEDCKHECFRIKSIVSVTAVDDSINDDSSHNRVGSQRKAGLYHSKIRTPLLVGLLGASICLSVLVVIWQVMIFVGLNMEWLYQFSAQRFGYPLHLLVSWTPYFYMACCVYKTLFGLDLAGLYGLHPKHTDDASLLFYSSQLSRFGLPLSFDYLSLLGEKHSSLAYFLGRNNLPGIDDIGAKRILSIGFCLLLLLSLLNWHSKLLRLLGLRPDQDPSSEEYMKWLEQGRSSLYKDANLSNSEICTELRKS